MDIGPVRNLLEVSARSPDLEPPSVFGVESSPRPADRDASPNRDKPFQRRRPRQLEDDEFTLTGEEPAPDFSAAVIEVSGDSGINIFA